MERYYYHGLGDWYSDDVIDRMIEIINSGGIKNRNEIRELGPEFNHICLYKKNDDYEYTSDVMEYSARGGWIDHCPFFIISHDITAEKIEVGKKNEKINNGKEYTNLIDEWRTRENIPLDKIVGIAIPFDEIRNARTVFPDEFSDEFDNKLKWLIDFANSNGWMIENSDENNLCDRLDRELSEKRSNRLK